MESGRGSRLPFAIIDLPSNLGLRPSGVETLPDVLRGAGLSARLRARDGGRVEPAMAYDEVRAAETGMLNGPGLQATLASLARSVEVVVSRGEAPVVLAGDCSVVLGGLWGLRRARRAAGRSDRIGLLFVDGHVDFYEPGVSPTGEVADMDLALATGRGPALLAQLDGPRPLVHDEDVAAVGARDGEERDRAGAQDVGTTAISLFELEAVRERGMASVAKEAVAAVTTPDLSGFWLHLDVDVLDDAVMPAVDYRQPDGLRPEELTMLLRQAAGSSHMAGVSVAIYNPELDPDGAGARILVDILVDGLASSAPWDRA